MGRGIVTNITGKIGETKDARQRPIVEINMNLISD